MVPQKLIIDADPGIGDALAIVLALVDPEIEVVAITAVGGMVSGRDATRNVQSIVDQIDPPKWPRLGSSRVLCASLNVEYGAMSISPTDLHGPSGLGDFQPKTAELHHPHDSPKLLADLVRESPNEITLLTLGPLTNVARACERSPEFLGQLGALVCCGGSVTADGDVTAAAEFNIFADPEAARFVLRSPASKTLVPLEIGTKVKLTLDQLDRIVEAADVTISILLRELLPFAFRAHHERLGQESLALQELAALTAVMHPRLFERKAMMIDVETSGELTRGMTVFDRRGIQQWQTNIDVLCDIDAQGVIDYLTRTIIR
ncbi:MAG: nucleoside hydrolase [Planctomycetota bacterium]|nr:nucleoside hydrolase [Planctomycetota bacterium]